MRVGASAAAAVFLALVLGGCVVPDRDAAEPLVDENGYLVGRHVRLVKIVDDLDRPILVLDPGAGPERLVVVEQGGKAWVVAGGVRRDTAFVDLSGRISGGNEQGLLGMAFAPDFPEDDRVFVSYTDRQGMSLVSSFTVDTSSFRVLEDTEIVLLRVTQPYGNHNGGHIVIGPDEHLYVGLGDGGAAGDPQANGQDPRTLLGSILRLDVKEEAAYGIPEDNPFADGKEGAPEVWVYGLRNPWRFSFAPDGALWIGDVGQDSLEEVNWLARKDQPGANLGWSAYEGTRAFEPREDDPEFVWPVAEYVLQNPHCAVTGGHVYEGTAIKELRGTYVFADFCSGWVWGLVPRDGDWVMGRLFESGRQVSSFGVDRHDDLYLVDHRGSVLRFAALET